MYRQLPHIITLTNLFCGCCALLFIFHHQYPQAFFFVLWGAIADFADGLVARMLDVKTALGRELDSLADMITFGMVPGAMLYMLLADSMESDGLEGAGITIAALPAFLVTLAAAYRLAKFNLDTRQTEGFIGLPTPSCTIFVVGLLMIYEFDSFGLREFITKPLFLYPVILVLSYLLIAELPMFSLKFKHANWKGNEPRFIFLGLTLLLLLSIRELTFSVIIVLYVLFSIFNHVRARQFPT